MIDSKKVITVILIASAILTSRVLVADQVSDSRITASIKTMLANEDDLAEAAIAVSTKDKVVKLKGLIDTKLQAHRAVELAQSMNGVAKVDDSGLKTRSSADYLRDAMISAKVKGKIMQLSNQHLIDKDYNLHVETTNGVVHIYGKLVNHKDASTIKDVIAKMDNVKNVNLNIHG